MGAIFSSGNFYCLEIKILFWVGWFLFCNILFCEFFHRLGSVSFSGNFPCFQILRRLGAALSSQHLSRREFSHWVGSVFFSEIFSWQLIFFSKT